MLPGIMGVLGGLRYASVEQTDIRTTAATSNTSVNYGADDPNRWIVVFAFHGNAGSSPGNTPTATLSGGSATRITAASTGNGGTGVACGSAIFVGKPSGTSGTVAVTWGALNTIIVVLRVIGYDMATSTSSDGASSPDASSAISVNIPSLGLLVGCEINNGTVATTWTNLTKRSEATVFSTKSISYGWDVDLDTQTGRAISWSPYSTTAGDSSGRAASFPMA